MSKRMSTRDEVRSYLEVLDEAFGRDDDESYDDEAYEFDLLDAEESEYWMTHSTRYADGDNGFDDLQRCVHKHLAAGRTIFDAMYEQSGVVFSIGEYSDMYKDVYGFRPRGNIGRENVDTNIPYDELTVAQRLAVDSDNPEIRADAATCGLALERLVQDDDPNVRASVAERGYGLDALIDDETPRYGTFGPTVASRAYDSLGKWLLSDEAARVDPEPLWYQVPHKVLDDAALSEGSELAPDFLCFEAFYQAAAAAIPKDSVVVDLGGYQGIQGWLFRNHAGYVDVDCYERFHSDDDIPAAARCELPPNGSHEVMTGEEWLSCTGGSLPDNVVVICSAVPDKELREEVRELPNHIVWYPGEMPYAAGPGAETFFKTWGALHQRNDDGKDWMERSADRIWKDFEAESNAGLRDEVGRYIGDMMSPDKDTSFVMTGVSEYADDMQEAHNPKPIDF